MYAGFSSKAGVISALMAQCGITGTKTCFEGKAGFLNVYFDGKYDRAGILDGLGSHFAGANIVYKPWPSCGITHVYIDAALELMRAHDIKPADVRAVKVFVGDAAQHLCEPLAGRQKPVTIVDAKFSIPFSIAVAIVHGNVKIDNFTAAALKDSDVLAMAAKVVPVPDANLNWDDGLPTGEVELTTYRGVAFRRRVSSPLGSPEKPMTWNNLEDKFADCARFSKKRLSDDNIKAFCSLVRKLEELPDIRNVLTCVA